MHRYANISCSWVTAALVAAYAAGLSAQAPAQGGAQTTKPAPQTQKPAPGTQKPATDTQKPAPEMKTAKPAMQSTAPGGAVNLGTVTIPRAVKAGGQALAAGTYQLRVTEQTADPPAPGQTPQLERWAEFLRGGKVVAREVVTVVPGSDIKQVAEMQPPPPPAGSSRTDVLKGGDYLRLWVNRGGNHYLVHFPM